MEIVQEAKGDLGAVLKIRIAPEDYSGNVEKAVKDYRKKVSMPGFRPGMVPPSLIKKMYGKSILVEKVNEIVSKSLNDYISEKNLQILGYPILENEKQEEVEWVENKNYEFAFELGLSPDIKADFGPGDKVKSYIVQPDDELIGKEMDELRKRYGQVVKADTAGPDDFIYGEFRELAEDGLPLDNGIRHHGSIMLHKVPDETLKAAFTGASAGKTILLDPRKLSKDPGEAAHLLGIDAQRLSQAGEMFSFTIEQISRVEPAEINQALFDKIFGENAISSEEEWKEKIRESLKESLTYDSESKLKTDIVDHLLSKTRIPLPDDFLKRWMIQASKEDNAAEDVDKNYEQYARGLKWQLLENRIIKDHQIKVEHDEALAYSKERIRNQLAYYGQADIPEEDLERYAHQMMHKEEEGRKIYDKLYDDKVFALIRSKITLVDKEIDFKEFVNLLQNKKEEKGGFFNFGFKRNKK